MLTFYAKLIMDRNDTPSYDVNVRWAEAFLYACGEGWGSDSSPRALARGLDHHPARPTEIKPCYDPFHHQNVTKLLVVINYTFHINL